MGMTRKSASVLTLGLIDFRSDRERTARHARKTAKEAKRIRKAVTAKPAR